MVRLTGPGTGSRGLWRWVAALALLPGLLGITGGWQIAPAVAAPLAITVNSGADDDGPCPGATCTLRSAIAAVAADGTIDFAPAVGVVTLTQGELAVGQNLTIQGRGRGGVTVARDASSVLPFRILHTTSGAQLTLRGLTIANGLVGDPDPRGGGILADAGTTLTVQSSVVRDNAARSTGNGTYSEGGGIHLESAALTLTNSTVVGNTADGGGAGFGQGGGISALTNGATASIAVTNSSVTGNTATGVSGGKGGGIAAVALAFGGATASAPLTVTGSTIGGNTASGYYGQGGGLLTTVYSDASTANAPLVVTNSTINGNTARGDNYSQGGGIYAVAGAANSGTADTPATLSQATVADNTATATYFPDGQQFFNAASTATIARSAFGGTGGAFFAGGGTITSGGYNVSQGDLPGATATDLINTDPQLGPLGDNGGPTPTRAPAPHGPLVDRIPAASCVATVDQRGVARPQPVGGACDSGAVEYVAIAAPTLTSLAPATVLVGSADGDVVVTGTGFVGGLTTATLNGTSLATTVQSDTQLTATVPAALRLTAGGYPLTVTIAAPGGGLSNALTFTVANPTPALTALAPTLASTGTPGVLVGSGDTALTLTGTAFAAGATVGFGGTTLTPSSVGATTIQVTVPAGLLTTARVVQIGVTNPGPGGGSSGSLAFAVANVLPTLGTSTPATATAGDGATTLAVTGTGFAPGSTLAVGGTTLATTLTGTTGASATIPAAALQAAGTLAITLTVPGPGGGTAGGRTLVVNPAGAAQLALGTGTSPQQAAITTAYATAFR